MADIQTINGVEVVRLNSLFVVGDPKLYSLVDMLVCSMNELLPHLTTSGRQVGNTDIWRMLAPASPTQVFGILNEMNGDRALVAMGSLAVCPFPTGTHGDIQDVVVHPDFERRGYGEALTLAMLNYAFANKAVEVNLTSRPSREAANRLYQRIGFNGQRETNVYQYKVEAWLERVAALMAASS